jgi:CheY-like chemotaxis protein
VSTKKILVVDDEATTLEMARISLELMGDWKVLLAATATAGLAMARVEQPDAILMEVNMRHVDGPAVLRCLLADETTGHIPVILLTEQLASAERRRYDESGVAGLICKPFHAMDLPRQVATLLGWRP